MSLAVASLLMAAPSLAHAATLGITVTNIPDATGTIRIAVCTKHEFLSPMCAYHEVVPSHPGQVHVSIQDIPSGIYAVQVFQDRNDNEKLDKNFFGIPQEPLGFSRNPAMHFGPPGFADSAFSLSNQNSEISLALKTK
ncbi:DUF2141 domain-containing protein [Acetobacter conturbans]|uniref:DUF2141 domain-containing protein n=1 Tax=Acetobacter conturbans TaxID=1737472 RepID=A0ABX0K2U8_9PROT|nr:DUF2141 domain-containing protein [Acetobacter conturbans]NHN89517.1 DUF2141 domain-containing protein [Acetobacter conturbans]